MTDKWIKLFPCPFCGGDPRFDYKQSDVQTFGVRCAKCHASTSMFYKTQAESIDAWNTRVRNVDEIRADERRKFAEILKSKPYFDEVHNMESIPISFIDEVLAEYQKDGDSK